MRDKRWFAVWRDYKAGMEIHDRMGVDDALETPPEQIIFLPLGAMEAVLEAAKDASWATKIIETTWTKELTRRHLDLLDKLVAGAVKP